MSVRKGNKNIVLLILLLVIVGMAVGYAALSQALVINGTANITTEWKILFTNIEEGTFVGAESKTAPSYTATTATFDVNLLYPGASAQYRVTVANQGNIDAKITSVDGIDTANAATPTDIVYSIDAEQDDELAAGATKTYIVTVSWNANANTIPETKTKTATITLNYEQAE
ncbi:MAG: hypothetical protein E7313_03500 [Clostridiales bacterium]|nr:hypothetical protein [Clostridiales bacterium]